ncbi:MAG TPA: hypothetical protein VMW69_05690 [Spirochaetia bacterium]|nr:hypothetical protein [Spirochaetia bacterium]
MSRTLLHWKWILLSIGIFLIVQLFLSMVFGVFGVLTLGIGFVLFVVVKPLTFFGGGFLSGLFSKGVTILEPAIGAALITLLGGVFDARWLLPHRLSWTMGSSIVAFVVALFGAFLGEKAQGSFERE